MGQGQSSRTAAQEPPVKTSYYELLGLERQATDDDIKKAYRRKALELHPDRNFGKEDEATKLFAEVSAAYEVLSDPQERAWYDSHESSILRGNDVGGEEHFEGSVRVTAAEEVVAMIGRFNGRVRFDDSPDGFFGYLRDAFARLAKEEEIAADIEGVAVPDYPSFGHKDDTHDGVVQDFYRSWGSFSTRKTFGWKDVYRLNEAPDRRIKRLMEKENKKRREEGIREFNDAVRALIAFVRKRDPRYKPNTQSEEERQAALRDASRAQAARQRAANAAKIDGDAVPDWAKARDPEDEVEISESESEEEHFECVACHKTFKSEKQFEAHEKSKKHQKAVQGLRRQMQKDNAKLGLDDDLDDARSRDEKDFELADEKVSIEETHGVESLKLDSRAVSKLGREDSNEQAEEDKEEADEEQDESGQDEHEQNDDEENEAEQDSEDSSEDSDYAPRSQITSRLNSSATSPPPSSNDIQPHPSTPDPTSPAGERKLGKAAQKRLKRAAAKTSEEPHSGAARDTEHQCANCSAQFPSKTRLFQHLRENPRHAALKAGSGEGKATSKKGGGRKKVK